MANTNDLTHLSSSFTSTTFSRGSGPFAELINQSVPMLIINAQPRQADPAAQLSASIELTVKYGDAVGTCRVYDDVAIIGEWLACLKAYLPRGARSNVSLWDAIQSLITSGTPVRFFVKRGGFAAKPNYPKRDAQ